MKYDHWIVTNKIIPPLTSNKFSAKAKIFEVGKGEVNHGLGEVWGKTESEANAKMGVLIEEWLKHHQ